MQSMYTIAHRAGDRHRRVSDVRMGCCGAAGASAGARHLPADVVSVLGRVPLAARQFAELLRVGNKLVLVSLTPTGAETLTEVTDPAEVDRLVGLCQQARSAQHDEGVRAGVPAAVERAGAERLSRQRIAADVVRVAGRRRIVHIEEMPRVVRRRS